MKHTHQNLLIAALLFSLLGSLISPLLPGDRVTANGHLSKASAQPLFSSTICNFRENAIQNPGAESGLSDWDDYNYPSVGYYGYSNMPERTDPGPADRGDNLFWGYDSYNRDGTMKQNIYLSSGMADEVATGTVRFTLSAYLGGYQDEEDWVTLTVHFFDDYHQEIPATAVTIGPVTAAERGNQTGLLYRSMNGMVPTETYFMQVVLTFDDRTTSYDNNNNFGYADNLSLVLSPSRSYLPILVRPAPPPAAPSNLLLYPVSQTGIDVYWTDLSTNESGFEVERAPYGSTTFTRITTTAANTTKYQDRGLSVATTYSYRVRAIGPSGVSAYTDQRSATTWPSAPAAPSGLTASQTTYNSTVLRWTDNANNEAGFELEQSISGGSYAVIAGMDALPTNITSVQIKDLQPQTNYAYRLRARNSGGYSSYSNIASITTLAAPPTTLRVNNASSDYIVSLKIDGVEQLPVWTYAIAENAYRDFVISAGTHTVVATTGFWNIDVNPPQRIDKYIWTYSVTLSAGDMVTIDVPDPSIEQLLTYFTDRMYWEGPYWSGTTPGVAGFCFYSNGRYRLYDKFGVNPVKQIGVGSYSLVSRGDIITYFQIQDDAEPGALGGQLLPDYGEFTMYNGTTDWPQITYNVQGTTITNQKCPVSAP